MNKEIDCMEIICRFNNIRLIQLRHKDNITQTELGLCIGVTKDHIFRLENMKSSNPTINTMYRLSKYFNVKIEEFIIEE